MCAAIRWSPLCGTGPSTITRYTTGALRVLASWRPPTSRRCIVTGAHLNDGRRNVEYRHHTKGVVSWFRSDLWAGNHDFKAGFDEIFSWRSERFINRQSGNYQLQYNNGAPFQIATFNYPVTPLNDDNYLGLYVQDSWNLARRLTLNLGVRYACDNAYAPAQCHDATQFVPRTVLRPD